MKRLLALVLSICMVLSCLPISAIALEAEPEKQAVEETQAPTEAATEETAGADLPVREEETAPVLTADHTAHGACICAVSGAACSHEQLTWTAWESTTSLPTEPGNYYLTGKVTVAATAAINGKVNLCLNGFSVDMNEKHIEVGKNDDLTILNCKATLKANGQLSEGNAKIYNGKHTHGAAVQIGVGGKFTAIGVEFADNNNYRESPPTGQGGGAVYIEGIAELYACRFVNNTTNNCGGAVAVYVNGTAKIDDCYFSGNSAANGGALSVYSGGSSTLSPTATVTGNTEFVGNTANKGGAVYVRRHANTPASYVSKVVLKDNTKITGNTSSNNGGGIYFEGADAQVEISGNINITGNTANGKGPNVYVWELTHKLSVGSLGANASVGIFTGDNFKDAATEPDTYLQVVTGAEPSSQTVTGVYFERDGVKQIAYNAQNGFYYPDHAHQSCICAITGTDCGDHGAAPIWTAWESTTSLPTEPGNYYLTGKVTVAATAAINGKVNLCLNGFSVDMNEKHIEVGKNDDLTILNCKATLKANGQLAEDNAKIYNGKNTHGAVAYVAVGGKLTVIGVEFYKNNNYRSGTIYDGQGGGAFHVEGQLKAYACRFVENTTNNHGGAIALYANGSVLVDDCYISGNTAAKNGGALSVFSGGATTASPVITITGDTEIIGNSATNNGGALFSFRNSATNAAYTARLVIGDNVKITGNSAKIGGGVYMNAKGTTVEVSGNVQITGNTGSTKAPNVYLWDKDTHRVVLGNLGANASIGIFTGDNFTTASEEPDDFLQLASGVTMADKENTGLFWDRNDPAKSIGYNSTDKFYYAAPAVVHSHGACSCTISGDTCSHEQLTWTAWESTTSLPTEAGNYYLTGNVTLAAITDIAADVNICLNGYNINLNGKKIHNTASFGIMNCQAELNEKNQLTSESGKIYGGDGTSYTNQKYGGAISTFGELKLIGVWFADNTAKGGDARTGGALYVDDNGIATIESCKFSGNQALSDTSTTKNKGVGGAISVYMGGSLDITDTIFENNTADLYGGAICVNNRYSAKAATVTIDGNCVFTGNKTNSTSDGYGSALYLYSRSEETAGKLTVTIGGNTEITGNTAAKYGAVLLRTNAAAANVLDITLSDNVKIYGNSASNDYRANLYFNEDGKSLKVGQLGSGAAVYMSTKTEIADPDAIMALAGGVTLQDMEITGFYYDRVDPAKTVGYSNDAAVKFYFVDNTVYEHDDHGLCICAINGETCNHSVLTWTPWKSKTSLPTAAGNYFLTENVTLEAVTDIAADVNICLNGYNINLNGKKIHNTASLGIMNCQATLNEKNQLTSESGKIYGGDGTSYTNQQYGGAISTFDELKLIGVWFADNTAKGGDARTGGALYVDDKGVVTIESCKFSGNQALSSSSTNKNMGVGGAISVYKGGSLDLTDTIFENNTADLYGGAICVNNRYATADSTVKISGNCEFTGNKTNSTTDGYGSALYLYNRSEDGGVLRVSLSGNTKITGNTAAKYGAVYLRTHDKAAALEFVVADDVNICDNTAADAKKADLYMQTMKQKVQAGQLSANFRVFVGTPSGVGDPDEFVVEASGVKLQDMGVTGFFYTNKEPAISVGHSTDDAIDFYFDMAAAQAHTDHSLCDCYLSGESCTDSTLTWKAWIYDDQLPTMEGNWYLTCDVKLAAKVTVKENVKLCLNGYNIDLNEKCINSSSTGDLSIINCKAVAKENGQLDETKSVGGKVTNGKNTHGAAIQVSAGGKFTAIGVEFYKNNNFREGSIYSGQGGGAIYTEGAAELYACRFIENTTNNHGGALAVYSTATAKINDCYFSGNTAGVHGGALSVYTGSSSTANVVVTLTGDNDFVGNTAEGQGGGIYIMRNKSTADGVNPKLNAKDNITITGNTAAKDGGGIAIVGSTTDFRVDLTGVLISGNTANKGGGVFVDKAKFVGTTITVSDNNAVGAGGAGGGIVGMGAIISLQTNTLVTGNKTEKGGGGGIYVTNASTVNLWGCTISKNESPDGGGVRLWRESVLNVLGGKIIENNSTAGGGGVSLVKGSILNMEKGEISRNTCKTNGAGVFADNYFQVTDPDYELPQLNLIGGKISGNTTEGYNGVGVYAKNCHTKLSGTVISGNTGKTANGGGIYASRIASKIETEVDGETVVTTYEFEPSFEMTGGEVSGNKTKNGGGIYLNDVDATITGGTIKNNTASENAGGISVRTAVLTFKGDAVVSGNSAKSGGGIIVQVDSTMNMSGGTVKGNKANSAGGILLWSRSVLNMRGGQVTGNKGVKAHGGGIYAQGGAHAKISGGYIGYNTAKSNGGGIYCTVTKDKLTTRLTVSGGTITGNYGGNSGGGAYLNNGAIANIYGGTWKKNDVKVCGGAMYANGSTANFYGGTFTENHALDCGGAVNAKTSTILVDGATFVENVSEARGGAFRIHTDCEFTMKSGKINDNVAHRAGGAIALYNCKVANFDGGEIIGNKVTGSELYPNPVGGGAINVTEGTVYTQYDVEINITGTKIAENYSLTNGGAIVLNGRSVLNISGGEIVNNVAEQMGGAVMVDAIYNPRAALNTVNITGGKISGNTATDGGAIYARNFTAVNLDGATIEGNTASGIGGALYLGKGTRANLTNSLLKGNKANEAAGFYAADDFQMHDLEVTGNASGNGYAVYIDAGEFDGLSYVLSIIKMSGDIRFHDNHGDKADLFIGKNAKINVAKEGLGKDTLINLELEEGVLTNTIIGAYNYEGGDRLYTVTYGDRSMTDLEPIPTEETVPEETEPVTEPEQVEVKPGETSIVLPIVVGVAALAIVFIVLILLLKRKNGKKN